MRTKLGILVLAAPYNGGTYQYTLAMLQALRHVEGLDITIYGDASNPDLIETGYPISPFAESRAEQLAGLAAHRMGLRLSDPFAREDIILAPIYSLSLLRTARPFAFALHDLQEKYYPENFSWLQQVGRHQIYRALLQRAERVICESHYVQNDIIRFFAADEKQIAVIPAPPQLQFSLPQSEAQLGAVRARLRLPRRFLLYPAQFWLHKNHLRLLEAFRGVVSEVPDLGLVLTGKKNDAYAEAMRAVDRLGLAGHVHHLGYIALDELQAVYQLATALVMPSLFESVSIPIYEAFQLGVPVIASGILAIPEQVGDAARLFDPTDVASIRDAILDVVRNPELAAQLAERGRERMSKMSLARYGAQLQALLQEMSEKSSSSAASVRRKAQP